MYSEAFRNGGLTHEGVKRVLQLSSLSLSGSRKSTSDIADFFVREVSAVPFHVSPFLSKLSDRANKSSVPDVEPIAVDVEDSQRKRPRIPEDI